MGKITNTMAKAKIKSEPQQPQTENGLAKIQSQYNDRLTRALTYKADSLENRNKGGELLTLFNEAAKRAKEEKDKTLGPAELTVKRIKEQWKPFEDGLKQCIAHIKAQMLKWDIAEADRIKKERERVLSDGRLKVGTIERKLAALEAPPVNNTRSVLRLEITDELLIPREYLVVDEVKLKAALREGVKVPGARLVNDKIIVAK